MKRRTSNRLAARAAYSAARSAWSASAMNLSSGIGLSLGEDEAEDGGEPERARRERIRPAVPDPFGRVLVCDARHAVDEVLQLRHRLGRREEGDGHGYDRVDREGR